MMREVSYVRIHVNRLKNIERHASAKLKTLQKWCILVWF